ncbi:type VI secretion system baseplate subunit TssG [Deltaproteobacteria bacterium Smac51]|nr:type VI secretion system baseplate subunit TssG [Deltaproteobacteria bacterium Smac51]
MTVSPAEYQPPVLNGEPNADSEALAALNLNPGNFAFAQAVRLVRKKLGGDESLPLCAPGSADNLRFRVNPDLSFPPSDINSISWNYEGPSPTVEMTLNLMGLHGAASPLPGYFTEFVTKHQDEESRLRDFFDLFNHRLICLFFDSWLKYRYHFQYRENASDRLSKRFFSFLGLGHDRLRESEDLDYTRLLSYMGLIAFNGESVGSLETILRHYFAHSEVYITPCVVRRVTIPEDQRTGLGQRNSGLSLNCVIGETIIDQTGKFRISIRDLNWRVFNTFLPSGDTFPRLGSLVRFVLRSQLSYDVELHLKREEIPPLIIGGDTQVRLAWSTWLGEGADGIVRLESGSEVI